MRLIIALPLCTAVGGEQFRKEWRKLQTRIMFEPGCQTEPEPEP